MFFASKYHKERLKLITNLPTNNFCALTQPRPWRMFQSGFAMHDPRSTYNNSIFPFAEFNIRRVDLLNFYALEIPKAC